VILAEKTEKLTQINPNKRPIEASAYYTIPEISDRRSPWYVASASTIYRALRNGALAACYPENRKRVLLSGTAIHAWLNGDRGGIR
jgi:hypothetical protein